MAITSAALQAELGTTMNSPRVLRQMSPYGAASQFWYISGGTAYPGRVKHIETTAADAAADQAVTVLAALLAGPA
jgi:hypothetical protein